MPQGSKSTTFTMVSTVLNEYSDDEGGSASYPQQNLTDVDTLLCRNLPPTQSLILEAEAQSKTSGDQQCIPDRHRICRLFLYGAAIKISTSQLILKN